jgi:lysozyme
VAALALSAAAFVGIVAHEGYSGRAVPPVPGDVPTYGFGTTTRPDGRPLQHGETITPTKAVERALQDVTRFEGALKQCVLVPLHQHEYDAYISLAYNIGSGAFCGSTLVRRLNASDYAGACAEIRRWENFQGKPLRGLTLRREREYRQCMGEAE